MIKSTMVHRSVFVSSTFRDMHGERDMIRDLVWSELSDYAETKSVDIDFVDLRWGVSTADIAEQEQKERLVLKVCLDRIDETRPFMIVLLGDRYGWIPEKKLLEYAVGEKSFEVIDAESVTALEIEYALLNDRDLMTHCFFYFRNPLPYEEMDEGSKRLFNDEYVQPGSPETLHKVNKLKELKEAITAKYPNKTRNYSAVWDESEKRITGFGNLAELILDDLKSAIDYENELNPPPKASQAQLHEVEIFFEKKRKGFRGREDILSSLSNFALNEDGIIALTGSSGLGKSGIMSQLYAMLTEKGEAGPIVLPFSCGISASLASPADLLRMWVALLSDIHFKKSGVLLYNDSKESYSFTDLVNLLEQLLVELSADRRVVLMIDGADQFGADSRAVKISYIPVSLPKNVSVIMSMIPCAQEDELFARKAEFIRLGTLFEEEIREITKTVFSLNGKPYVSKEVFDAIAGKQNSENPIVLTAIIQDLLVLDEDDFNTAASVFSADPDDVVIEKMLLRAIEELPDIPEDIYPKLIQKSARYVDSNALTLILGLFANSAFGLRVSDVEKVFTQSGSDFSNADIYYIIKRFKSQFFQTENGAWMLNHMFIRNSMKSCLGIDKYISLLADLFSEPDLHDPYELGSALYYMVQDGRAGQLTNLIFCVTEKNPESLDVLIDKALTFMSEPGQKVAFLNLLSDIYARQNFESDKRFLPFITKFLREINSIFDDDDLRRMLTELDNGYKIDRFIKIFDIRAAEYIAARSELAARLGNPQMAKNMSRFAFTMGEKVFGERYFPIHYGVEFLSTQFSGIYGGIRTGFFSQEDYRADELAKFIGRDKVAFLCGMDESEKEEMDNLLLRLDHILIVFAKNMLQFEKRLEQLNFACQELDKYDLGLMMMQSAHAQNNDFYFKVMRCRLCYCATACEAFFDNKDYKRTETIHYFVCNWSDFMTRQKHSDDPFIMQYLGDVHSYGAKANYHLGNIDKAQKSYEESLLQYHNLYRVKSHFRHLLQYLSASLEYSAFLSERGDLAALEGQKRELLPYFSMIKRRYAVTEETQELYRRAEDVLLLDLS